MGTYLRAGENPPVAFVAQLGVGGDSWKPIIDRLPDQAAFAYDRPGTGDAPARLGPPKPLPHSVWADELADLLDQNGITEPAIVVGHSFGGNIARVFAGRYPDRVAGLVFVDCSIPQSFLIPGGDYPIDGDGLDATPVDTVAGQVEILTSRLPDVPAAVLTRTHGRWDGASNPPHPAAEDLWLVSQRLLAEQVHAPLIVADDCGHQLPRDVPNLVAYAVQAVIEAVSAGRPVALDEQRLEETGGHLESATDLPRAD